MECATLWECEVLIAHLREGLNIIGLLSGLGAFLLILLWKPSCTSRCKHDHSFVPPKLDPPDDGMPPFRLPPPE